MIDINLNEKKLLIKIIIMMIFRHSHLLFYSRNIGGPKIVDTEVHSVVGACVSMQRRELSFTELPEDEASGDAHEEL
jgi:hypothetical protein